jgi:hypothetical protein
MSALPQSAMAVMETQSPMRIHSERSIQKVLCGLPALLKQSTRF